MSSYGHSDHPLKELSADTLGLKHYATSLADFIRHCGTPLTVAIQGDWGTGKTSLMHMVERELAGGANGSCIKPIWFNTWQYSQFNTHEALPASLLSSLLTRMADPSDTYVEKSMQVLGRLVKPVANAAIRFTTAGIAEFNDFTGSSSSRVSDPAADAAELRCNIAKIIERKTNGGTDRFVIFIDDLDRILPERAVEVLEVIKLFLDLEGCVFVLALDYAVVTRGLKERFKISEADLGVRSFFDKIIQLPFTLPVTHYNVPLYMEGLLTAMDLPLEKDDHALFAKLAEYSVSTNPRAIKRVLNSLQLLILVARRQKFIAGQSSAADRLAIRNLFAVLCLEMRFKAAFNWLSERGGAVTEANVLALKGQVEKDGLGDPGLETADLEEIIDKYRQESPDYTNFAAAFVECVQAPGHPLDQIDAEELERLRKTLTLTRITAVAAPAIPERAVSDAGTDDGFRYRNRRLMHRVQAHLRDRLSESIRQDKHDIGLYQPHSTPSVDLWRKNIGSSFASSIGGTRSPSSSAVSNARSGAQANGWKVRPSRR